MPADRGRGTDDKVAAAHWFMAGAQIDYALTPIVRLSALPLVLQLQPSFDGARSTPLDASGVWMRATIAIGAGVDL